MTFIQYSYENREIANSYLSLEELNSIFETDLFLETTLLDNLTDDAKKITLMTATKYIDTLFIFKGTKKDKKQRLKFPRNFEEENIINDSVKNATAYLFQELQNNPEFVRLSLSELTSIKREKADIVEVEYFKNKSVIKTTDKINLFTVEFLRPYTKKMLFQITVGAC